MKRIVRNLNGAGIDAFRGYLAELRSGVTKAAPKAILDDATTSDALDVDCYIDDDIQFGDKLEFGAYLAEALRPLSATQNIDKDVGLWTWLAVFFFEQLCPKRPDGTLKPGADERYILSVDYKRVYRQLVRTPYLAYSVHGDNARVLLVGPIYQHGELTEQIASRKWVFLNTAMFELMADLYLVKGKSGWRRKKGFAGQDAGGTSRRLGKVLRQFDLVYDFIEMNRSLRMSMLPDEFDRFR